MKISKSNSALRTWVDKQVGNQDYYLPIDLARALGKNLKTIKRWISEGSIKPSLTIYQGKNRINLFDDRDLIRVEDFVANKRLGRPTKYKEDINDSI